ncbi:unnamed protein product [Rotaria magnacalcarata]|uniref:TIP41-like protein n=1 Tax=Rotaria magnacalcarata TaxID=392030 RepID=A0A815TYL5_9BILA|nr:unnamed protein product [Rotaria magnacalcarata]CAF1512484.1 unnamed protein product [Rotaria magnacalcarata]CAF1914869.1 unnamed protein product [Rotaria magnacalcarata]CAF3898196.1 unnamed protein product [Rotaria magnacalcarata]CAF3929779.1 unnamed protein product [Rotaria magnacalcarata]
MSHSQPIIFNNEWSISTTHGSILSSEGSIRREYEQDLKTTHLPEMIFDKTTLKIIHLGNNFEIRFNAFDALKSIDMYNNLEHVPKVAMSDVWTKSHSKDRELDYVKPYDWTYTTKYKGTLCSSGTSSWRIESTNQELDLEKLKRQEPILFYDELTLYEDELADNGTSNLTLKIRCMPSGFFILLRFFMRVDGVLARCFDTRYHYEVGKNYVLREYVERESPISSLKPEFQSTSDDNAVIAELKTNLQQLEKLFFKESI